MRSAESAPRLAAVERSALVEIARDALVAAVNGAPYVSRGDVAGPLAAPGASFVSLHDGDGALRGCIGSIAPCRPLADDVAANARAAALEDDRFAPVRPSELADLAVEISVLSPLVPLAVGSRSALLAALRRGVDGLLLDDGDRRATFLPAVWRQLPEAELFLAQLERKAGLPVGGWSPRRRVWRYTAETVRAAVAGA